MPAVKQPRPTQAMRRQATIAKLIHGATESLIQRGYAGTTVEEICERAEVSHGGMFRHFRTREALMVAVAEHVGREIMAGYRREFDELTGDEEPLQLALHLVRRACRSRINQAWLELTAAARTNRRLRTALQPVAARYYAEINELARTLLPDLAKRLGSRFDVMVEIIIAMFDGETMHLFITPRPEDRPAGRDNARLFLLLELVRQLSSRA